MPLQYEVPRGDEPGRRDKDREFCLLHESRLDGIENNQANISGWIRATAGIIVIILLPLGTWATTAILTDLVGLRALMVRMEIASEGERRDYVNLERRVEVIEDRNRFVDQRGSK
jgi:hypothetical protein